jgi:hypothetical protein
MRYMWCFASHTADSNTACHCMFVFYYSLRILFDVVGQFKITLQDVENKNMEGVLTSIT